jgi:hypothetical protein
MDLIPVEVKNTMDNKIKPDSGKTFISDNEEE